MLGFMKHFFSALTTIVFTGLIQTSSVLACSQIKGVHAPDVSNGDAKIGWPLVSYKSGTAEPVNLLWVEYDISVQDWVIIETHFDPHAVDYVHGPDDFIAPTTNGGSFIVIPIDPSASRPPGANPRPPGGPPTGPNPPTMPKSLLPGDKASGQSKCTSFDDVLDLGNLGVSGSSFSAFDVFAQLMGWGGFWAHLRPPPDDFTPPPPPAYSDVCETGEPAIDDHEAFFEEAWEASGYGDVPIENGGFALPNDSGGYDYLWFGDHIPAALGACSITLLSGWQDTLPENGEWPEGSVFIHSHPHAPYERACSGTPVRGGASNTDKQTVRNFKTWFDVDLDMVIIDPVHIYHYKTPDESDQDARQRRCGY